MNMQWKNIYEFPPPSDVPILLFAKDGLFKGQNIYIGELGWGNSFYACDVESAEITNVSHWSELPKEPGKE